MKKLLCILFALVLLPVAALAYNGDMTVYITRTGECYHLDGCSSLRRSAYAIRLEDAVNSGYRACQNCGAPYLSYDSDYQYEESEPEDAYEYGANLEYDWDSDTEYPGDRRSSSEGKEKPKVSRKSIFLIFPVLAWLVMCAWFVVPMLISFLFHLFRLIYFCFKDPAKVFRAVRNYPSLWFFLLGCSAIVAGYFYAAWQCYIWGRIMPEWTHPVCFSFVLVLIAFSITWATLAFLPESDKETTQIKNEMKPLEIPKLETPPEAKSLPEPEPMGALPAKLEAEAPPVLLEQPTAEVREEVMREVYCVEYEGKFIRELAEVPSYITFDSDAKPHIMMQGRDAYKVYLAGKGCRYHTATCRSVRKTKRPLNLYDAVASGYTPCSQCKPPVLPNCVKKYREIDRIRKRYKIDMLD